MASNPIHPEDQLSDEQKELLRERSRKAEQDNKTAPSWDEYKTCLLEKKLEQPPRHCTP